FAGQSRPTRKRAMAASPARARSITRRQSASPSPSKSASARRVVRLRAPLGRPAGFPECPGAKRPFEARRSARTATDISASLNRTKHERKYPRREYRATDSFKRDGAAAGDCGRPFAPADDREPDRFTRGRAAARRRAPVDRRSAIGEHRGERSFSQDRHGSRRKARRPRTAAREAAEAAAAAPAQAQDEAAAEGPRPPREVARLTRPSGHGGASAGQNSAKNWPLSSGALGS